MERYYEMMRNMIALTDTGIEALEYLADKLYENSEDAPFYLYIDFSDAFLQLCQSYNILDMKLPQNRIKEREDMVCKGLIAFENANRVGDMISMDKLLKVYLIPAMKVYRAELAACINPYILC